VYTGLVFEVALLLAMTMGAAAAGDPPHTAPPELTPLDAAGWHQAGSANTDNSAQHHVAQPRIYGSSKAVGAEKAVWHADSIVLTPPSASDLLLGVHSACICTAALEVLLVLQTHW
jgi:hypothetical protein